MLKKGISLSSWVKSGSLPIHPWVFVFPPPTRLCRLPSAISSSHPHSTIPLGGLCIPLIDLHGLWPFIRAGNGPPYPRAPVLSAHPLPPPPPLPPRSCRHSLRRVQGPDLVGSSREASPSRPRQGGRHGRAPSTGRLPLERTHLLPGDQRRLGDHACRGLVAAAQARERRHGGGRAGEYCRK